MTKPSKSKTTGSQECEENATKKLTFYTSLSFYISYEEWAGTLT